MSRSAPPHGGHPLGANHDSRHEPVAKSLHSRVSGRTTVSDTGIAGKFGAGWIHAAGRRDTLVSMAPAYPIGLEVDDATPQSRLTVLFRMFMIIPHVIILEFIGVAVSVVTLLAWFAILFTGKYPAGLMTFAINAMHWQTRYSGYAFLLTGAYPPFAMGVDAAYPVRLIAEGQIEGRNRLTVFFRYFMLIPQILVLYFVLIAAGVVLMISWLVALFTGSVPAGMHNFLAGTLRWQTRVGAYGSLLTDQYPPFSLS